MITIEVNDRTIEAAPGEMLLDAMRRAGIHVPTLCHVPGLTPTGACRLCVVEVAGQRGLVPSCAYPVQAGMKVHTHSPRAVRARKTIVELLLAAHPDDCLYCVRNGKCELQGLARELGVGERRFAGARNTGRLDVSSPALVRDPAKCILCGKCIRYCEEIQGIAAIDFIGRGSATRVGTAFDQGLNVSSCINCGQCILVCPTGALREQSDVEAVDEALRDPGRHVVVQHAPAISVTLAEELGLAPGRDVGGILNATFRALGFDAVFDTAFAADLTIMEEAAELVQRIRTGGRLPMMTSCSPGWIKFVEQCYPDFLANLSTCKSPQQMLGAMVKTCYAERQGLAPESIFSVSVMPCTAKKFEATRTGMGRAGVADVDAVLTTRELARFVRARGVDPRALDPEPADTLMGERSTAGKLFGVSGGVMEAAVRTAHYLITGRDLEVPALKQVRGLKGVKQARIAIDGLELGITAVNGLANAAALLEQLAAGRDDLHFIEVMTCPGGCIGGGGQPIGADIDALRARMRALYRIDRTENVRASHRNESVQRIYREFLGAPLGERSHHLLHTCYAPREVIA